MNRPSFPPTSFPPPSVVSASALFLSDDELMRASSTSSPPEDVKVPPTKTNFSPQNNQFPKQSDPLWNSSSCSSMKSGDAFQVDPEDILAPTPIDPHRKLHVVPQVSIQDTFSLWNRQRSAGQQASQAPPDFLFATNHNLLECLSKAQDIVEDVALDDTQDMPTPLMTSSASNGVKLRKNGKRKPPVEQNALDEYPMLSLEDECNHDLDYLLLDDDKLSAPTSLNIKKKRKTNQAKRKTPKTSSRSPFSNVSKPDKIKSRRVSEEPHTMKASAKKARKQVSAASGGASASFRGYQNFQWEERYSELEVYREERGNCLVPHNYSDNIALAKWVKRQRYQYKLKQSGKHSTLTDERETMLNRLGFVWESHKVNWLDKYHELQAFVQKEGHANVPSTYPKNPSLAVWTQCQRRQFKLLKRGDRSYLTQERQDMLESVGFVWEPRSRK